MMVKSNELGGRIPAIEKATNPTPLGNMGSRTGAITPSNHAWGAANIKGRLMSVNVAPIMPSDCSVRFQPTSLSNRMR